MTQVVFDFLHPSGLPRKDTTFAIVLRRPGFVEEHDGVVVPDTIQATTDDNGEFTLNLQPSSSIYKITIVDLVAEENGEYPAVAYQFYVPDTTAVVRAQDLFLAPAPTSVAWDEAAIIKITKAVADSKGSAIDAAASAHEAATYAGTFEDFAERSEAAAVASLDSSNKSKTSATQSATSASGSAASAAAALASQNASKTSETNAKTSETNAGTSRTNAANSATAASGSAAAALTSQNAAKASQDAAKTSETNAKTSETNSANSATASSGSATASSGSAAAALTSQNAAKTSETNSKTSETNSKTSETNSAASAAAALASKNAAATSETNANTSKNAAAGSATTASTAATTATTKASEASASATDAASSKTAAKTSETNSKTSETNAKASETQAKQYSDSINPGSLAPKNSPTFTGDVYVPIRPLADRNDFAASTNFVANLLASFGLGTETSPNVTDLNNATQGGFYRANGGATNSVGTGVVNFVTIPFNSGGCMQILNQLTATGNPMWYRTQAGGTWSVWRQMANVDSPVFTGDPKVPTPAATDEDTSIANTAFVRQAMALFGLGGQDLMPLLDLNAFNTRSGWYYCSSTSTGTKPAEFGVVLVSSRATGLNTATWANQTFYATNNGKIYNRFSTNLSAWSAWEESATNTFVASSIATAVAAAIANVGTQATTNRSTAAASTQFVANLMASLGWGTSDLADLVSGTDPDTVTAGGSYQLNSMPEAKSPSNGSTIYRSGVLFVMGTNAQNYSHQFFGPQGTNKLFHRISNGATNGTVNWYSWVEMATTADVLAVVNSAGWNIDSSNAGLIALGANKDLNTVQSSGSYGQAQNANATLALNYPVAKAGTLLVQTGGGSITTQMYTEYDTGAVWTRSRYNTVWSAWVYSASSTQVDASIAAALNNFKNAPNFNGEVTIQGLNAERLVNAQATYGMIMRMDPGAFYFLLTNQNDPLGNFNDLRPFALNLATGLISMNNGVTTAAPSAGDRGNRVPNTNWVGTELANAFNALNLGATAPSPQTFSAPIDWAKPNGWSGFINLTASYNAGAKPPLNAAGNAPRFSYGTWTVFGKRDNSNGYTGILVDYASGVAFIGSAAVGSNDPIWKEVAYADAMTAAIAAAISGTLRAKQYIDPLLAVTATGTYTMVVSERSTFELTLSGNTTLAFSGVPALNNEVLTVLVTIKQGATARTLTMPANTTFITSGGVAIPTPGANKQQDYIFTTKNGTNWECRAGAST